MIRTPLRPLARILSARAKGENPDEIERANVRERHEASPMNPIETVNFSCPWCGEPAETAVDCTAGVQAYVEDCWCCCRPMVIVFTGGDAYARGLAD